MCTRMWTAMVMVVCVGAAGARAVTLNSVDRATGAAAAGYEPVHGYPVIVRSAMYGPVTRGAFEYSLTSAPSQFQITSLSFEFHLNYPIGLPFRATAYLYVGNGTVEAGDFLETELAIGTTPFIETLPRWVTLTATDLPAINAALGFGAERHVGFTLVGLFGDGTIDSDRLQVTWTAVPAPGAVGGVLGLALLGVRRRR